MSTLVSDIRVDVQLPARPLSMSRVLEELGIALDAGAAEVVLKARENISSQMNSKGQPGGFADSVRWEPGPGDLQRTIGSAHPGARAQELGAVIRPKTAKMLHFVINGIDVFRWSVRLPQRPYLEPAFRQAESFAQREMEQALGRAFSL